MKIIVARMYELEKANGKYELTQTEYEQVSNLYVEIGKMPWKDVKVSTYLTSAFEKAEEILANCRIVATNKYTEFLDHIEQMLEDFHKEIEKDGQIAYSDYDITITLAGKTLTVPWTADTYEMLTGFVKDLDETLL